MIGFISAGLVFLACLGSGAAILRLLGVLNALPSRERPAWSFAVGFGFVGWLMFFLAYGGWLRTEVQAVLLTFLATGSFLLLVSPASPEENYRLNGAGRLLLAALLVALALDWVEALAPPADADSLAYHFAIPKEILRAGHLIFVPRPVDGAVPLLVEMTFLPALALGGEPGLTYWTMLSGWMATAFVYVLCRRFLGVNWSLAAALVFLTTPAVVYGAGSGQVEVRLALFTIAGSFALAEAVRSGDRRFALLAGLAAGFFSGGKYTGLLFVAACGLALLPQRRWLSSGLAFALAVLLAGFQWYAWNWWNTGDPVFPMLFDFLGAKNGLWDDAHAAALRVDFFDSERALPLTPLGAAFYPLAALFAISEKFESLRTGFGPFVLLGLPFAIGGIWTHRRRLLRSRLAPVATIVVLFYFLWYFTGSSQRLRHLLPVYPLLLIGVAAASARWANEVAAGGPLAAAMGLCVVLQLGGEAVFSMKYLERLARNESREAFYGRQVSGAEAAFWINGNLGGEARLFHSIREINYLLDIPYFSAVRPVSALIDVSESANPETVWTQLRTQGITHMLLVGETEPKAISQSPQASAFVAAGCAEPVKSFSFRMPISRTLSGLGGTAVEAVLLRLLPGDCRP